MNRSQTFHSAAPGLITIPARCGKAVRVRAGDLIKVINTHGKQVVDTWALNANDTTEFMSMEHTRAFLKRLAPRQGDSLVTNQRRPILSLEQDTTAGVHDTLIAACDRYRYAQLGVTAYHANCADNLATALRELQLEMVVAPCPLNLFMNIPVDANGNVEFRAPVSETGQYVALRAQMDAVLIFSACPQDMLPINGEQMNPTEVHLRIN
jgi:hypothetical protein